MTDEKDDSGKIKSDRESIIAWAIREAKKRDPQSELFPEKKKDEDAA